ncbi:flagellar basal body rod protein FlgB [Virgibacillus necropolis]|uniref:Flagellar basal body rod protein FlgB n=1 Tax=Virgibacillus necropolis TaxID=163877 RepID=A0A221MDN8_9BACI|nr:flagellar basal body rod protein FlgB [Virgibacillus necropolis]ASN05732.1 flagellar basal body rod protein FlgB [Virgibacillus necropolis]
MGLFEGTIRTLENSLDYATAKNRVISNNVANVDTPNYNAKEVVFKHVLNDAISGSFEAKRTNPKHLPFSLESSSHAYQVRTLNNTMYNHNGNNVDIDKEMSELAKNQIYYQGLVDRLSGKFGSLQTVIRGGR